jgi:dTDP-4-dehydrorhamnose 3,5-epimerase
VFRVRPRVIEDERGFFFESWNARTFSQAGLDVHFVQDNHSRSHAGCLRGLHYQLANTQDKLVRVVVGEIFDVAVDLRRSAPTFGQWVGVTLSAANHEMLWVPAGFAHGFYVLSEEAEVLYKCTDYYSPTAERTLLWNDQQLSIAWPLLPGRQPELSSKDAAGALLRDAECFP